jgi:hypothetical protein
MLANRCKVLTTCFDLPVEQARRVTVVLTSVTDKNIRGN